MASSSTSSTTSSLPSQHAQLLRSFSSSSSPSTTELKSIGVQLTKLKIALTQAGLLVPSSRRDIDESTKEQLVLTRDVLEVGAFWSIRVKDVKGFDRYIDLLRVFYTDLSTVLPPSSNQPPLLGLSLLRLLSSNAIASFHTTLETLSPSLVSSSPFLQHPINLERWLMEGSYSKVWRSRNQVPREEYSFFVDGLMETIRHEIATCEEKAYDSLPLNDAATLLFFDSMQQVSDFANERGWQINPSTQTVHFITKSSAAPGFASGFAPSSGAASSNGTASTAGVTSASEYQGADVIPKRAMIASNLSFARELESIV